MSKPNKVDLLREIDQLATRACRLMTTQESEKFFKYQEKRSHQRSDDEILSAKGEMSLLRDKLSKLRAHKLAVLNNGRNAQTLRRLEFDINGIEKRLEELCKVFNSPTQKKYSAPIRSYYKGARKGKRKDVYDVDGRTFERLWTKLSNYANVSSMRSHFSFSFVDNEVQDDVLDIKYQCFFVLRFWGPRPNGKPFSQFFKLIVNNVLTTSARRRGMSKKRINYTRVKELFKEYNSSDSLQRRFFSWREYVLAKTQQGFRTRVNYCASSLFDPVGDDDENPRCLVDIVPSTDSGFDITSTLPDHLKEPARMLIGGEKLSYVAKTYGVSPKELKREFENIL